MCAPAIVAGIGTALSVVGSVAGAAVQAQGIQQQAEAQAVAEERRAELADRQAEVNATQASFERKRVRNRLDRVIGQNRAEGAERGLSETGSLVDVQEDSNFEASQDLEAIRYRADGERDNLKFEAGSARQRAASSRQAGKIGAMGAYVGGFTSAATTLGNSFYRRPLTATGTP